jgi:hypothetical protein
MYDIGQEGIHVKENAHHVTIQNCVIHDMGVWREDHNGEGIYLGCSPMVSTVDNTNNIHVRRNIIYNTTDEGIDVKMGTHHHTIEDNIFYNNNYRTTYPVGAIEISPARWAPQIYEGDPEHIIRGNYVLAQKNVGIMLDSGATVYGNVVAGIEEPWIGIHLRNPRNDKWVRNVFNNAVYLPEERAIVIGVAEEQANVYDNIITEDMTWN